MGRRRWTVRELATEAGIDIDEALLLLWESGIEEVLGPDDHVSQKHAASARKALSMPSPRRLRSLSYLAAWAGMDVDRARDVLAVGGVRISPGSDSLARGQMKRARRVLGITGRDLRPEELSVSSSTVRTQRATPVAWKTIGTPQQLTHLNVSDVVDIHERVAADFRGGSDPIQPFGVRDQRLLESALARPKTGIGAERKYPSAEMASAALLHSLVLNHPFHNGNKRTGVVAYIVFLDRNGHAVTATQDDLFRFVIRVAQHGFVDRAGTGVADREVIEMAEWTHSNTRVIERGERPVRWRELRQVLTRFGCETEVRTGNRLEVSRWVREDGLFNRVIGKRRHVKWIGWYGGDGTEASRNLIHGIRSELELDEGHGVDSSVFYGGSPPLDEFVVRYRSLIRRLARV